MGLTVPSETLAGHAEQAEPKSLDFQILATRGTGVVSGCLVTQRAAGANMSVDVAAGTVRIASVDHAVTQGNVVVTAANGTNPRRDAVVVNTSGTKSVIAGTAAPDTTLDDPPVDLSLYAVLFGVYVPAGATSITNAELVDKRVDHPASALHDKSHIHDGADGSGTVAHSATTGQTANDHHNQAHLLADQNALGGDHTIAGGVAGYVLRALSATTAKFMQLVHGDLGSVGANDHHNQSHLLADQNALGADHTIAGAAAGWVLRALSATTAKFVQMGLVGKLSAATGAISTTETVVVSGTVPASSLAVGDQFRITAIGAGTTGGTPGTGTWLVRMGPTTLTGASVISTGALTLIASRTSKPFLFKAYFYVVSTGASGTVQGTNYLNVRQTTNDIVNTAGAPFIGIGASAAVVDTTVANLIELTFVTSQAGSSAIFTTAFIERL